MRKYTNIPTSRVLSSSANNLSSVDAEYTIMEEVAGISLFQQWGKMTGYDKLMLIKSLNKLESQFASIRFIMVDYIFGQMPTLGTGNILTKYLVRRLIPRVYSVLLFLVITLLTLIRLRLMLSQMGILILTVDLVSIWRFAVYSD